MSSRHPLKKVNCSSRHLLCFFPPRLQDEVALTMFRFRIAFGFLLFGAVLLVEKIFQADAYQDEECYNDHDCGYDLCCKRYPYDSYKRCTSCHCYANTDCENRRECCVHGICTTSNCTSFPSWKITLIVIGAFLTIALPVASISYCRCQSRQTTAEIDRRFLIPTISSSNVVSVPNVVGQSGPSLGLGPAYVGQPAKVYSDPTHI